MICFCSACRPAVSRAASTPLSQRASRIGDTSLANAISPKGPLFTMRPVRGAPHAHRASQLDIVRDALAPLDTDEGGQAFVEAVAEVATALKETVFKPTSKGDASKWKRPRPMSTSSRAAPGEMTLGHPTEPSRSRELRQWPELADAAVDESSRCHMQLDRQGVVNQDADQR